MPTGVTQSVVVVVFSSLELYDIGTREKKDNGGGGGGTRGAFLPWIIWLVLTRIVDWQSTDDPVGFEREEHACLPLSI